MTREEILNMPAGNKIDALVSMMMLGQKPDLSMCRFVDGVYQPHAGKWIGHVTPLDYSVSIANAWTVLVRMNLTDFAIEKAGNHYCVVLAVKSACAETAPLAICRAALLTTLED